jgi:hypothetical protein
MSHLAPLIGALAKLLDANDRETVLGDLAEAGSTPSQTVIQLFGLIVRRYVLAWTRIEPWLALLLGVVPIGLLLSFVTRWFSNEILARVSWYRLTWFPGYFDNPGIRGDLLDWALATVAPMTIALVGWSWSLGLTTGRLCRNGLLPAFAVLLVALFAGTAGTTTTFLRHATKDWSEMAFAFTAIVRVLLVAAPVLFGILGARKKTGPQWLSIAIMAIGIIGATLFTATQVEFALTFGRGVIPLPGLDNIVGTRDDARTFIPWVSLLVLWPLAYVAVVSMLAMRGRRRQAT